MLKQYFYTPLLEPIHSIVICFFSVRFILVLFYFGRFFSCFGFRIFLFGSDLGSARTELIFTRSQGGTQPGGLTQPGQTEQGILYHVSSCWVPAGGRWATGRQLQLGSVWWWQRSVRVALRVLFCFMYSPYLYRCCYCSLCLLFC